MPFTSVPGALLGGVYLTWRNQAVCGYVFDQKTLTGIKARCARSRLRYYRGSRDQRLGLVRARARDRRDALRLVTLTACKFFPNTPICLRSRRSGAPTRRTRPRWLASHGVAFVGAPPFERAQAVAHENVIVVDGASILPRSSPHVC